jgi:hypothetical protein
LQERVRRPTCASSRSPVVSSESTFGAIGRKLGSSRRERLAGSQAGWLARLVARCCRQSSKACSRDKPRCRRVGQLPVGPAMGWAFWCVWRCLVPFRRASRAERAEGPAWREANCRCARERQRRRRRRRQDEHDALVPPSQGYCSLRASARNPKLGRCARSAQRNCPARMRASSRRMCRLGSRQPWTATRVSAVRRPRGGGWVSPGAPRGHTPLGEAAASLPCWPCSSNGHSPPLLPLRRDLFTLRTETQLARQGSKSASLLSRSRCRRAIARVARSWERHA